MLKTKKKKNTGRKALVNLPKKNKRENQKEPFKTLQHVYEDILWLTVIIFFTSEQRKRGSCILQKKKAFSFLLPYLILIIPESFKAQFLVFWSQTYGMMYR